MKWFCFALFVCAQTFLLSRERPTQLNALVVYDAGNSALKQYYRQDSIRMKKSLKAIATLAKLTPHIRTIKTSCFSRTKFDSWIKQLSSKDVAVFYYAGRPFYNPNDLLARLPFSKAPSVTQKQRTSGMMTKAPYLGVMLFDCYSKVLNVRWPFSKKEPSTKVMSKSGITRLFAKTRGVVIACSTSQSETGYAIKCRGVKGGLFSLGLQDCLQTLSEGSERWFDVLASLKCICERRSDGKQHPLVYDATKTHYLSPR